MATEDLSTILAFMLADLPQIRIGKHIHAINFLVGEKVFAFMKGDGVTVKLPREKVNVLVAQDLAVPLVMGKRVMKEWVVITHAEPEEYKKDRGFFKESIAFVASKA